MTPPFDARKRKRGRGAGKAHFNPSQPRGGDGRWVATGKAGVIQAGVTGRQHAKRHSWGKVEDHVRIYTTTGFEVRGYDRVMRSSEVSHALISHGKPGAEAARGQVAIAAKDFERIPKIVSKAHSLKGQGKTNARKPPRLIYTAKLGRHEYTYVETIHTGVKEVALKSLFKRLI